MDDSLDNLELSHNLCLLEQLIQANRNVAYTLLIKPSFYDSHGIRLA